MTKKLSDLTQKCSKNFKESLRHELENKGVCINCITIVSPMGMNRIGVEVSIIDDNDVNIKDIKESINFVADGCEMDIFSYKLEI